MVISDGGDDRIRTCEGLLTLNGLANRRLQPLGHISATMMKSYSKRRGRKVKRGAQRVPKFAGNSLSPFWERAGVKE